MAAWIHALRQPPCSQTAGCSGFDKSASRQTDDARAERRATGMEQMLVNILAAMTQANAATMEA
jgi:hypothetical protein